MLLIAFAQSAFGGPVEDALASLEKLTADLPSLIVQTTQGEYNMRNLQVDFSSHKISMLSGAGQLESHQVSIMHTQCILHFGLIKFFHCVVDQYFIHNVVIAYHFSLMIYSCCQVQILIPAVRNSHME